MTRRVTREELTAAAGAYMRARLAVREFFQNYFNFWRPMSEQPPEPGPPITDETIREYEQVKAGEDAAREEWERVLRRFVETS